MVEFTHAPQRDVAAFHRAMGVPIGQAPAIRNAGLRADLIHEECWETIAAIEDGDLIAAIDGLCDLIYVAYGAAVEFGVDLAPFWDEVQRANLEKIGGPRRRDGKIMKPKGWKAPSLEPILAAQIAASGGEG